MEEKGQNRKYIQGNKVSKQQIIQSINQIIKMYVDIFKEMVW